MIIIILSFLNIYIYARTYDDYNVFIYKGNHNFEIY